MNRVEFNRPFAHPSRKDPRVFSARPLQKGGECLGYISGNPFWIYIPASLHIQTANNRQRTFRCSHQPISLRGAHSAEKQSSIFQPCQGLSFAVQRKMSSWHRRRNWKNVEINLAKVWCYDLAWAVSWSSGHPCQSHTDSHESYGQGLELWSVLSLQDLLRSALSLLTRNFHREALLVCCGSLWNGNGKKAAWDSS